MTNQSDNLTDRINDTAGILTFQALILTLQNYWASRGPMMSALLKTIGRVQRLGLGVWVGKYG